jgi:hypothetical protein
MVLVAALAGIVPERRGKGSHSSPVSVMHSYEECSSWGSHFLLFLKDQFLSYGADEIA